VSWQDDDFDLLDDDVTASAEAAQPQPLAAVSEPSDAASSDIGQSPPAESPSESTIRRREVKKDDEGSSIAEHA